MLSRTHVRIKENGTTHRIRSREGRVWMVASSKHILPHDEQTCQIRQPHWKEKYGEVILVCDDCRLPTNHTSRCSRAKQKVSGKSRPPKTNSESLSLKEMWKSKTSDQEKYEETGEQEDSEDSGVPQDSVDSPPMSVALPLPSPAQSSASQPLSKDADEDDDVDLDEFEEDDPGGQIEKESLLSGGLRFVTAVRKRNVPRSATIYGAQVTRKDANWMLETKRFSPLFSFPNVDELTRDPFWKDYALDATAWVLSKCQMHYLDYEGFYGDQLCSNFPYCKCQEGVPKESRQKMRRNGLVNGFRITRGMTVRQRVLIYFSYRCDGCPLAKLGKKSRVVSGISPEIIAQLPDRVRDAVDIVATKGWVMDMETHVLTNDLRERIHAFDAIAANAFACIQTALLDLEKLRLDELECRKHRLETMFSGLCLKGPRLVDFAPVFAVTSTILKKAYCMYVEAQEPLLQASFIHSMKGCTQVSMDMNHPNGYRGNKAGHIGTMDAMNEYGEVLFGQAQYSKSIVESKEALKVLRAQADFIEVFHTDEPAVVHSFLEEMFEGAKCVKDVYHLMNLFTEAIHQSSPYAKQFWGELSTAIFRCDQGDLDKERTRLLAEGKLSMEEIDAKLKDRNYVFSCQRIRHYRKTGEEIWKEVEKLYERYLMTDLFRDKILAVQQNVKAVLEKFFAGSAPAKEYFNSGTEADPVYHPIRGTNNNENLHGILSRLNLGVYGIDLQHCLYNRALYCYSQTKRIEVRGLDLLKGVRCPLRMNEFVVSQERLKNHLQLDRPYFTGYVYLKPSELRLSGFKFVNPTSKVQIARRYLNPELAEGWHDDFSEVETNPLLAGVSRNVTFDPKRIPVGVDFDFNNNKDESKFMRMLLGTNEFWKKKSLISAGGLDEKTWQSLAAGNLAEMVDVEKLTIIWNVKLCSGEAAEEEEVMVKNESIKIANLKPKERSQMMKGIKEYASRVSHRARDFPAPAPISAIVTNAPSVTAFPPPPHVEIPSVVTTAAPNVYSVDASAINRSLTVRMPSVKRQKASSASAVAAPAVGAAAPSNASIQIQAHSSDKKTNVKCPECGLAKHGDGCAFLLWYQDTQKLEYVPRNKVDGRYLSPWEAHRAFWLVHGPTIRLRYCPSTEPSADGSV